MSETIYCVKLKSKQPRLTQAPYVGELGKRLLDHVSQPAWEMWLNHQTMLINENRLSALDPKAREFLSQEMEQFFFGEGSKRPDGYVKPEETSH